MFLFHTWSSKLPSLVYFFIYVILTAFVILSLFIGVITFSMYQEIQTEKARQRQEAAARAKRKAETSLRSMEKEHRESSSRPSITRSRSKLPVKLGDTRKSYTQTMANLLKSDMSKFKTVKLVRAASGRLISYETYLGAVFDTGVHDGELSAYMRLASRCS